MEFVLILVAGTAGWSAPKGVRRKVVRPNVARSAVSSEIEVYHDGGGVGGRHAGSGQGWTLRPNGTVTRTVSLSPAEMDAAGNTYMSTVAGTFKPSDFAALMRYLQTSRLLDLTAPRLPDDGGGSLSVSLVRGGRRQSIVIPDAAPPSAAVAVGWVMLTLVRGITAETDWKNSAGNAINTGLCGSVIRTTAGLTSDSSYSFDTPLFSVLNAAGQAVGRLRVSSESGYFSLVLPPGAYQLVFKKLDSAGTAAHPPTPGYAWRAMPATVQVQAGSFTPVTISLEKTPVAP